MPKKTDKPKKKKAKKKAKKKVTKKKRKKKKEMKKKEKKISKKKPKKKEKPKKKVKKEEKKPPEKKAKEEKPKEKKPEKLKEEKPPEEAPKKIKKPEEIVTEEIGGWIPKTKLGKSVMRGQITDINEILEKGIKIMEHQIVDRLVPNLENELVLIGGRPGKGGGIERTPIRISAKMHRSGRRYISTSFAIVGNKDGIVGIGKGRGKEGRSAVEKAIQKAKLNIIKVPRGCGSWECGCDELHSIPFKTTGKAGSVRVELLPAPKGIGLAVDDETKKILRLAGIKDVWGQTLGDTGTRFNLIKAVFHALKNLHRYRTE